MNTAISVENLGKSYTLTHKSRDSAQYVALRDVVVAGAKRMLARGTGRAPAANTQETFWALNDVSFAVPEGQRVGIIGRNGAGKSTLLKIISRITSPSRGRLKITGRVASLLEVGTGFHPELTGRENIFLNGAVLGMSRSDIRRRFNDIVEFAEVERFLDTPVKRYSSGMYMRLAFAVAAHLEPDILVVDEVLAVGDAEFQKKCLGKMKDVGSEGRTVLFVSHNMGAISEFCSRAILLDKGNVYADGSPSEMIALYSGKVFNEGNGLLKLDELPDSECSITQVVLRDARGQCGVHFDLAEAFVIEIDYVAKDHLPELQIAIAFMKDGAELFHAFDSDDDADIIATEPGRYRVRYTVPAKILREGQYTLRITAGLPHKLLHDVNSGLGFEVSCGMINTLKKSYRADRPGVFITPGFWSKQKMD